MKHILCFGDSNTFASHPLGGRHPYSVRFTGRLQTMLGAEYRIIEEGLGGRTTVFEDEIDEGRKGIDALPICLGTHKPLDLVVLMLGTNDLKARYNATLWDLKEAMRQMLRIIETYPYKPYYKKPDVLLVSPILIGEDVENSLFGCFTKEAAVKSRGFSRIYSELAKEEGVYFLDAAQFASPSREDKLHMDAESHHALADALYTKILEIMH